MRQDAFTVILSGLASLIPGPPRITPPDWVEYYQAPDGSIVEVVGRFWENAGRDGLTVFIQQYGPNGEAYRGRCEIARRDELEQLPRMERNTVEKTLYPSKGEWPAT